MSIAEKTLLGFYGSVLGLCSSGVLLLVRLLIASLSISDGTQPW